jgi:hypothetical protein
MRNRSPCGTARTHCRTGARHYSVAKVSSKIAHAPAQARAAEAAPLTRKGHKSIPLAVVADDAQEPVRQDPALEERLDLFDHEARQLRTRFAGAHLGEESGPVRLQRLVEDRVLGAVALVGGAARRCRSGCQGGLRGGHPESSSDPSLWFRGPPRRLRLKTIKAAIADRSSFSVGEPRITNR